MDMINIYDLRQVMSKKQATKVQQKLNKIVQGTSKMITKEHNLRYGKSDVYRDILHYDLDKVIRYAKVRADNCHSRWRTRMVHEVELFEELRDLLQEL